ncbi:MAG TPA: hypothetical protein VFP77_04135 [Gemmatimonadaceae bacterium]|nr:hypothetical protein [Gemmatimonadaceae bacterium]
MAAVSASGKDGQKDENGHDRKTPPAFNQGCSLKGDRAEDSLGGKGQGEDPGEQYPDDVATQKNHEAGRDATSVTSNRERTAFTQRAAES